ncbi:MAG: preprotein translocase subunit SecE [Ruminococcus flavefaciens]|nr:preprotein translocase subunit SecE [Ruminococcus flavefaciens]
MAKEKENTAPEKKKVAKEKPAKEEKKSNKTADSKADKKSDKKKSEKKEQGKVGKWFHDLKVEFKKVVWPTKKTVFTNTSVVVGVIAMSAVLVGLLDEGFLALLRLIYH